MYISDYGYAASPNNWTATLKDYDNITSTNWLYLGKDEWTISRRSPYRYYAFYVDYEGKVDYFGTATMRNIRPTFYLNSNVEYVSGNGTSSSPYRIQ